MVKLNTPDRLFYWVTRRFSGYHAPADPVTRTRMDAIGAVLEVVRGEFNCVRGWSRRIQTRHRHRDSVRRAPGVTAKSGVRKGVIDVKRDEAGAPGTV